VRPVWSIGSAQHTACEAMFLRNAVVASVGIITPGTEPKRSSGLGSSVLVLWLV
jgi:hypothetical protein